MVIIFTSKMSASNFEYYILPVSSDFTWANSDWRVLMKAATTPKRHQRKNVLGSI